jgi:DeoR/GlpR family transcriptional regulator of sugar metabolism
MKTRKLTKEQADIVRELWRQRPTLAGLAARFKVSEEEIRRVIRDLD